MKVNRSSAKKRDEFLAYESFMERQGGIYPPSIAMHLLGLSSSGIFSAGERGRLDFVVFQGRKYYGKKSVSEYIIYHSRKKIAEKKPPASVAVLTSEKYDIRIEVPVENLQFLGKRL